MPTELDYAYFASGYHIEPREFLLAFIDFHVALWLFCMEAMKDTEAMYDNALKGATND